MEVQRKISGIDEQQREVNSGRERFKEQELKLSVMQEEMNKAEDRSSALKLQLKEAEGCHQTTDGESLQCEEEQLRSETRRLASVQAILVREVECMRTKHEELEKQNREMEAHKDKLEKDIENARRKPKQEDDGRATVQEIATLRHTQVKAARDLYALQVTGADALTPLPSMSHVKTAVLKETETCVSKYADLRQGLLQEWSNARLDRLGEGSKKENADSVAQLAKSQVRLQHLQLKLAEVRTATAALKLGVATEKTASVSSTPALRLNIQVQKPLWAATTAAKVLPSVSLTELQSLSRSCCI